MFRKTVMLFVFSAGLLLAANTPAHAQQTGPVLHLDEESLFLTVADPAQGLGLVVLFDGNPGDFLRLMPDGRTAIEFQTNDALLLLVDLDTGGIMLGGPGTATLSETDICDFGAMRCVPDGERTVLHVHGELSPAPGAPAVADVTVQQIVIGQVERQFAFDVEPL